MCSQVESRLLWNKGQEKDHHSHFVQKFGKIKSLIQASFKCLKLPYARHYNPLLIWNRSLILTIHKARILRKKPLEKTFLNFKKWVKSIQTAGYNGARTVYVMWTIACDKCIWWLCVTKMLSIAFHWHCFSLLFPSSLLICTSLINCYYPSCHVWTYLVHSVKIHVSSVIVLEVTHDELVWLDNSHFSDMSGPTRVKFYLLFCLLSSSKHPFTEAKKIH